MDDKDIQISAMSQMLSEAANRELQLRMANIKATQPKEEKHEAGDD